MKPLLEVTNKEDALNEKEKQLNQIVDQFERQKNEFTELNQKQNQLTQEKHILSEQLQAESELCAEAEEVGFYWDHMHFVWFPCEMDFSHHTTSLPIPPESLATRDSETSGEKSISHGKPYKMHFWTSHSKAG